MASEGADFLQRTISTAIENAYNSLPGIFALVILIAAGYIVGYILKRIVMRMLANVRVDEWLEEQNLAQVITGHTLTKLIGNILQWSVVLLFMAQGAELMRYEILRNALHSLVYFIYVILAAVTISITGLVIGRYVRNIVETSVEKIGHFIGVGLELFIIYIAIVMALELIPGINTTILKYAFVIGFGSIALAFALAIGISFGLAFKDEAQQMIKEINPIRKKRKKKSKR